MESRIVLLNNYWMRFFGISRTIKVEVAVIYEPKAEAGNPYRDLDITKTWISQKSNLSVLSHAFALQ